MSQNQNGQQGGNQGQRSGFQPQWRFAQEFTCDLTGVSVVVNKTNHQVPQYSVKVGRYKGAPETTPLLPFIGARVTRENIFSGVLETDNLDALLRLVQEAKEWIKVDLANACDEAQARAEAREQRAANRDKPETRTTGKTARKKGLTPEAEESATAA